jgi:hypothetical protein
MEDEQTTERVNGSDNGVSAEARDDSPICWVSSEETEEANESDKGASIESPILGDSGKIEDE